MMIDTLLDELIQREGGRVSNPLDKGGETIYGIAKATHPEAWKNGPPTLDEAKAIYFNQYVITPGFHRVQPEYLAFQLVDFGVLSGTKTATMALQKIIGEVSDGQLGPSTLATLAKRNPETINTLLVKARVQLFVRIVQKDPTQLAFLFGWVNRALNFLRTA